MATNPLFIYHPPTDEQKVLYARLAKAHADTTDGLLRVLSIAEGSEGPVTQKHYEEFTNTCENYYNVIMEVCPASADRTAAIRCLRLARNAVNDVLRLSGDRSAYFSLAGIELIKCRYQANASIALEGKF